MARGRAFAGRRARPTAARRARSPRTGRGVVVKADGLAAGKGVTRPTSPGDAAVGQPCLERLVRGGPATGSSIEERLAGREASVIAICDGRDAVALPAARDHKRLRDGDDGPNTGGMGAYSPLADLPDDARRAVLRDGSTGRSSPSWPGAGRRSAARSTPG